MDKFRVSGNKDNNSKMSRRCPEQWRLALAQASNAALALAVVAATLALRKGIIPPARRGFSCGDQSITFPTKARGVFEPFTQLPLIWDSVNLRLVCPKICPKI